MIHPYTTSTRGTTSTTAPTPPPPDSSLPWSQIKLHPDYGGFSRLLRLPKNENVITCSFPLLQARPARWGTRTTPLCWRSVTELPIDLLCPARPPKPDTLLDVSPETLTAHDGDNLDISSVLELEIINILQLDENPRDRLGPSTNSSWEKSSRSSRNSNLNITVYSRSHKGIVMYPERSIQDLPEVQSLQDLQRHSHIPMDSPFKISQRHSHVPGNFSVPNCIAR